MKLMRHHLVSVLLVCCVHRAVGGFGSFGRTEGGAAVLQETIAETRGSFTTLEQKNEHLQQEDAELKRKNLRLQAEEDVLKLKLKTGEEGLLSENAKLKAEEDALKLKMKTEEAGLLSQEARLEEKNARLTQDNLHLTKQNKQLKEENARLNDLVTHLKQKTRTQKNAAHQANLLPPETSPEQPKQTQTAPPQKNQKNQDRCREAPSLHKPLGEPLAHVDKSGDVICAVSGSGTNDAKTTTVVYSTVYCGDAPDGGVRAKWFTPYIFPDRQTQLIDTAEVEFKDGKWFWKDKPFPGGAPDIVVNSLDGTGEKMIKALEKKKSEQRKKTVDLPEKYTDRSKWTDGVYFPMDTKPHSHTRGIYPFHICYCDETWFCGKREHCDVILDMVREPW